MTEVPDRLPDWLVERAALDEVPATSRVRLDGLDAGELAARVAQLQQQNRDELTKYPAAAAVKQIDQNAAAERISRKRRKRFILASVTTTVTLAVATLVMFHTTDRHGQQPITDTERVKGTARLLAFRQGDHVIEKLENDAVVKPGDTIQLRYNAGGAHYGMIASVDGNAVVTLHFPSNEDAPTEMAHDTTTLPDAYTLDDAPRFERFFILTSEQPIDVKATLASLKELAHRDDAADATLDLPNVHQAAFRLKKGTP